MTDPDGLYVQAPAKINLFLHVLAQEVSGFHQIETLFAAVDFCDELRLELTTDGVALDVVGADVGPEEDNLAYRAARSLLQAAGAEVGVRIGLTKCIPPGTGLGGGSSDAGATLRALNVLLGSPMSQSELLGLAVDLGADVPFFVSGAGRALAWGRGERLMDIPGPDEFAVLLALPPVRVATADAYGALTAGAEVRSVMLDSAQLRRAERVGEIAANDFEASIFASHPELGLLREAMEGSGALTARLSGSGGAIFALFPDRGRAESAAASLAPLWTGVKFLVTHTLVVQPSPRFG